MGPLVTPLDLYVFFGSLIAVMALGLWAGRREETSEDYFLGGHRTKWWGVTGSIFGSNVSSDHIISMMGIGFTYGFAQSHFEITAIAGLLMLCYGFLPVYRKLNVFTLSEYLSRRYGESSRLLYAVIMIVVMVGILMVPAFYIGSRAINILIRGGETATARAIVGTQGAQAGRIMRIDFTAGAGYQQTPAVEIDLPPSRSVADRAKAKARIKRHQPRDPKTNEPLGPETGVIAAIDISDPGAGYDPLRPPAVRIAGGANYSYAGRALRPGDIDPQYYLYGILLIAVVTGVYTVAGGLRAVIITDVLQSLLILAAALTVAFLTFGKIGGWTGLLAADAAANGGRELLHLYLPTDHPELPATGVLSGLLILHFFYWGTNQFIVQRALSARSDREARLGIVIAGFLKLLIPFMSISTGIAAYYFFRERNLPVAPDAAFTELMRLVVAPVGYGLLGLVAAGVIGAIMSTIDSILNSSSTVITFDLFQRYLRPQASQRTLIWVGRLCVVLFIVAATLLAVFTMNPNDEGNFFLRIASHQSKLVAGVVVAFGLGMLWKRATAAGATTAIVVGILASYLIPLAYSGHLNNAKLLRGYTGSAPIQEVQEFQLHAPRHGLAQGDLVRFYKANQLPAADVEINQGRSLFVRVIDADNVSLHGSAGDAQRGTRPVRFLTAGSGQQTLYLAGAARTVSFWGVKLNFMHIVALAALAALAAHVLVSLLTPLPSVQQSGLTWTGLGGHSPLVLRKTAWKVAVSLVLFGILGWLMTQGNVSPLVAGLIGGGWTFLMFLDAALASMVRSHVAAFVLERDLPATSRGAGGGDVADEPRGWSLLEEDRFWAGILAAMAVFMMFYFY